MGDNQLTKMLIVTDYDTGFQLMPTLKTLPEVAPGDSYTTECKPQETVTIQEIISDPFAITQIAVGETRFRARVETRGTQRVYLLGPPLVASPDDWIRIQCTNDTDASHKQKIAVLVRQKAEPAALIVGPPRPIKAYRDRVNIVAAPEDTERELVVPVEVEHRCGFCGEVFEMSPLDPHGMLIAQADKNFGRGRICPKEPS
jgi:hypothetical protein